MDKKIFLISVAALGLIFVAEDWTLYRPGARKLQYLQGAIVQSRNQFLGSQISAGKFDKIKQIIEQNTTHGPISSAEEGHASRTLGRLMNELKELKIELLSIEPKPFVQTEFYTVTPVALELRCRYHQFASLLDAIEKSDDLVDMKQFSLAAVQEEVVASLSVEIYTFVKE